MSSETKDGCPIESINRFKETFYLCEGFGVMSVELGVREGLLPGYPVLYILKMGSELFVGAREQSYIKGEGENNRRMTVDEEAQFVKIAELMAPDSSVTKCLRTDWERKVKRKMARGLNK